MSVLGQDFQDFELIVVDDCSTDDSLRLIEKIISSQIKFIKHQTNRGLSASRNTGIRAASSDYITFLDADDLWDFGFLTKIKSLIDAFPEANLFATNYTELYSNGRTVIPKNNFGAAQIVSDFFLSNLGKPIYCTCSLCVHRQVFEQVGYYNEKITFGEDVDYNIRINAQFRLAYANVGLMTYRMQSENQITNSRLSGRTITDFDRYEKDFPGNDSIQKYIDFNRFVMAKTYKLEGNKVDFKTIYNKIKLSNLNFKQRMLLGLPRLFLIVIKYIKMMMLKFGLHLNSYSK